MDHKPRAFRRQNPWNRPTVRPTPGALGRPENQGEHLGARDHHLPPAASNLGPFPRPGHRRYRRNRPHRYPRGRRPHPRTKKHFPPGPLLPVPHPSHTLLLRPRRLEGNGVRARNKQRNCIFSVLPPSHAPHPKHPRPYCQRSRTHTRHPPPPLSQRPTWDNRYSSSPHPYRHHRRPPHFPPPKEPRRPKSSTLRLIGDRWPKYQSARPHPPPNSSMAPPSQNTQLQE